MKESNNSYSIQWRAFMRECRFYKLERVSTFPIIQRENSNEMLLPYRVWSRAGGSACVEITRWSRRHSFAASCASAATAAQSSESSKERAKLNEARIHFKASDKRYNAPPANSPTSRNKRKGKKQQQFHYFNSITSMRSPPAANECKALIKCCKVTCSSQNIISSSLYIAWKQDATRKFL